MTSATSALRLSDEMRWPVLLLIGIAGALFFGTYDYLYNFGRFWDFNVYIKAQAHFAETGSPYFERESLRYIYPPSANFILYLVSDSAIYKTIYFIVTGMLWTLIALFFCRRPVDAALILPILFLAFGMQGWVTVLSGNIATIMYFIAAFAAWAYFTGKIPTLVFAVIITALVMIKPFYAEFLLFIWFVEDLKKFILFALGVVVLFFAVNLIFFPELFSIFLDTLKVEDYDNEIFGITIMSVLMEAGGPIYLALIAHLGLLSGILIQLIVRYKNFSSQEQFACIFIIAVFLNPKQITYDLIVCVPALTFLLLTAKRWVFVIGLAIIILASVIDLGLAPKPWFQWWLAFMICFLLALFSRPFDMNNYEHFFESLFKPERP